MSATRSVEFTGTEWSTADDKAKMAAQLIKFIESGCPRAKFTKRLYNMLSTHMFGHIAHHDSDGFYHVWFSSAEARVSFLKNILKSSSLGDPHYTWSDVERHIRTWLRTSSILDEARAEQAKAEAVSERSHLAHLLRKYPDMAEKT